MRSQATRSLKTESGEKNSKEDKFYLEEKSLQTFVRSNYRNNQGTLSTHGAPPPPLPPVPKVPPAPLYASAHPALFFFYFRYFFRTCVL